MANQFINIQYDNKAKRVVDNVYLILTGVYLAFLMSMTSTFFFQFPAKAEKYLLFILFCCVVIKTIFAGCNYLNNRERVTHLFSVFAVLWISILYLIVYQSDSFVFLLYLGVLTIGCVETDYRKLLRMQVVLIALFLLVTCISGLGGAIENYVFMKDGSIRSTWGICYPTDFASYVFFFLILLWVVCNWIPSEAMLLLAIFGMWLSRFIAMSVTSTICCGLFALVLLGRILYKRNSSVRSYIDKIKGVASWWMILSFPLLAVFMFLLIAAYAKEIGIAAVINNLLSERLHLPLEMYRECGLKPFGTPFEQVGAGFSTFAREGYNFVDSSYPLILIRYGWILFLTLCFTWSYTIRKAIKCGEWRLAIAMTLIAVHAFSEHHFIEVNYNLLVVMPFADYLPLHTRSNDNAASEDFNAVDKKRILAALAAVCLVVFAGLIALPVALSWMRTIVEILGWYGGGKNGVKVAVIIISAATIVCGMLLCIFESIIYWNRDWHFFRIYVAVGALCIAIVSGALLKCNRMIENSVKRYENLLTDDEEALELIISLADGKVFANEVPEIYNRRFSGMSSSIFYKDELARCYNVTAVMDKEYDSACFINSGFLFTPISKKHAIYTNDVSVIRGLQQNGYHLTGYYNVEKSLDMAKVAHDNRLSYGMSGNVHLDSLEHSLIHGPYLSLYSGVYSVWFDLSLDKSAYLQNESDGDEVLGTVRTTAYYGKQVLKEQKLFASQFDEHGRCSVEVRFGIGNYYGIEFLLLMEKGHSVNVDGIRYARTPSYDVHSFYDRWRNKYRDEYYSLEGQRIVTEEGYTACEYEYNYDRAVNEIRYYDENNESVLIKAGYAQVKRKLDGKNRVIREEYYGTDGQRILLPQGYSANEKEYDENGNVAVQRYYDSDDKLVITSWDYAEIHKEFDSKRRTIREAYYGNDGRPLTMPQGYSVNEREYDEEDNVIVQRYCDAAGKPVLTTWNYAEVHREFNAKKQVVKESYYDESGKSLSMPQGYAMNEREYDEAGNAVVQRYCDASNNPVMTTWNYAEVHREFDEERRIIWESYYNTEGESITLPAGYAQVHREYNDKNQVIQEGYYDKDRKLVNIPQGYAVTEREYDEAGNAIVQRFRDDSEKPVITVWNYAEVHREFDSKKQVIRESYYGVDGKPLYMSQGYSTNEREYDDNGNAIVQRYYDESGRPVITTWNYAEVHREFDGNHRIVWESYYDTEGNPVLLPAGYAVAHREYNDKNQVIRESYYDIDRKPIYTKQGYAVNEREYDEDENPVVQKYCDVSGMPVMTTWGFAEVHREFDEKHRIVYESYYDIEGKPMQLPSGKAAEEREYDQYGHLAVQRFYSLDKKPVMLTEGYCSLRREYDEEGTQTKIIYYDLKGQEVISK